MCTQQEVADELDLPRYAYASNAAITTRLMQVHHEIKDKLIAVPDGPKWILSIFEEINKMPGLEFLRVYQDIPPVSKENGWFQFFLSIGEGFATADGIVFNSFSELEGTTIQHIHNAFPGRPDLKVQCCVPPFRTVVFCQLKYRAGWLPRFSVLSGWDTVNCRAVNCSLIWSLLVDDTKCGGR